MSLHRAGLLFALSFFPVVACAGWAVSGFCYPDLSAATTAAGSYRIAAGGCQLYADGFTTDVYGVIRDPVYGCDESSNPSPQYEYFDLPSCSVDGYPMTVNPSLDPVADSLAIYSLGLAGLVSVFGAKLLYKQFKIDTPT